MFFFKGRYYLIGSIFYSPFYSLFDISLSWDNEASPDQVHTTISHYRGKVALNKEDCIKENLHYISQSKKITIDGL